MLTFSTLEQRKILLWVKSNIARLESIMAGGGGGGTDLTDYYTKTQTDTLLSTKANTSSVYSKNDVDSALTDKANTSSVYTKQEIDSMVGNIETLLSEI